ncbi:DNA-directed RNA polymerase subunit alpha C-terminal domain-containing protein [Actinomadura litoris]|uniref:RNA polymerase alpha subunit C-terminal domain-containing protein n=1 Tax=Actinomadura litoris TaxID=2678616 RepID=A0A7K1LB40_9ACTN|nr:DNA-directed RNA polymerase subunit alpha C-terminal domain-containing protein [Actinomadura litoris]MUN41466.1 hypothetical protein [Actinomadura litoris]
MATTRTLQPGDPIALLNLSPRAYNALMREGIRTIGDLAACDAFDLLDIRNFGTKSLDDVHTALIQHGLALKNGAGPA